MNENVSKISPDTQHAGSHGTWHANRVIALCVFSKRTLCAVWGKAGSISPDMAQVFGTGWVQLSVMSGGDGWSPRCARSCLGPGGQAGSMALGWGLLSLRDQSEPGGLGWVWRLCWGVEGAGSWWEKKIHVAWACLCWSGRRTVSGITIVISPCLWFDPFGRW